MQTKQNWSGYSTQFAYIYNSKKWRKTRAAYLSANPFCEVCASHGVTTAASIVHHVVHLNEDNVKDAAVVYGFENLAALCGPCHFKHHNSQPKTGGRFDFDEDGNVFIPYLEGRKEKINEEK